MTHGRGDVGALPQTPAGGLSPQPQSSSRALPCPCLVSVDSSGSLCASRKCPQGTRSPPSPCTPFLGLRPKPRASRLACSLLLLEMKLRKGVVFSDASQFFDKLQGRGTHAAALPFAIYSFLVRVPAPRVGFWGVAPNGYARPKQDGANKLYISWGEAPMRGCRGIIPLPGRGAEPHIVPL